MIEDPNNRAVFSAKRSRPKRPRVVRPIVAGVEGSAWQAAPRSACRPQACAQQHGRTAAVRLTERALDFGAEAQMRREGRASLAPPRKAMHEAALEKSPDRAAQGRRRRCLRACDRSRISSGTRLAL